MALRFEDNMNALQQMIVSVALFFSTISSASEDIQLDYENLLKETKSHIKKAQEVNGLWRDTILMLDEAKNLYQSNNHTEAIKLLKKANSQAKLGVLQAENQKDNELIPHYLK